MISLGAWSGGLGGDCLVYVENGVLRVRPTRNAWGERTAFKRAFGARFFGDESFLVGLDGEFVGRLLRECDGKSEEEVLAICDGYKEKREERRTREALAWEKWQKLRERFDGVVIGIDSKIDVYGAGFSVRVLFGSDVSFGGKKKFLAENKVEFVRWVMHELSESKSAMRKIGDMRFYRLVEIVNLRANEVEVKFEVKKEVA